MLCKRLRFIVACCGNTSHPWSSTFPRFHSASQRRASSKSTTSVFTKRRTEPSVFTGTVGRAGTGCLGTRSEASGSSPFLLEDFLAKVKKSSGTRTVMNMCNESQQILLHTILCLLLELKVGSHPHDFRSIWGPSGVHLGSMTMTVQPGAAMVTEACFFASSVAPLRFKFCYLTWKDPARSHWVH